MNLSKLIKELQHIQDECEATDTQEIYLNVGEDRVKLCFVDFKYDKYNNELVVDLY